MDSPRALKAAIRTERLALRDAIPADERRAKSLAMAAVAVDHVKVRPGEIVSGFLPIRSEADIGPMMTLLRSRGARLCLPIVRDKETILFRAFDADTALVSTGFGTSGPGDEAEVLDPALLLMPLSAFDAAGNRIGYGAGHYDRAIDRLRKKGLHPRLIGIAFDCQEVASVPAEPHDVGLDGIITESGYRAFLR